MSELCPTTAAIVNLQNQVSNLNTSLGQLVKDDGTIQQLNQKLAQLTTRIDQLEKKCFAPKDY